MVSYFSTRVVMMNETTRNLNEMLNRGLPDQNAIVFQVHARLNTIWHGGRVKKEYIELKAIYVVQEIFHHHL